MIGKRDIGKAPVLLEVVAMDHGTLYEAVLPRAVELIGAGFKHDRHPSTRGVPCLRGLAGRLDLHFRIGIFRGHERSGGVVDLATGNLGIHAVQGVRYGALALTEDVKSRNALRLRVEIERQDGPLVINRQLGHCVAFEHPARGGILGCEQRRHAFDFDGFRCRAQLHLDIDTRGLRGTKKKPFLGVDLESGGRDGKPVRARIEIGKVVRTLLAGGRLRDERRRSIDHLDLGERNHRAGWILDGAHQRCPARPTLPP